MESGNGNQSMLVLEEEEEEETEISNLHSLFQVRNECLGYIKIFTK